MNKGRLTSFSWMLVALFATVTLVRGFIPALVPAPLLSALVLCLPPLFFLIHGPLSYRFSELLVFGAITLVVSNIFENMSVLTGFPFGYYSYTATLGPKLFHVPVLIGPAYLGTGYLAWTVARVIVGAADARLSGQHTVTVPLLASFMMVSWDLALDPIFATIYQSWLWRDGGSYFGVPFGNFLGWLLTTFAFFQVFALYLRGQRRLPSTADQPSRLQSLPAILFYGLKRQGSATVTDPAGMVWRVQDIYAVTGLIALFTMGAFTILGLVRLLAVAPAVPNSFVAAAPPASEVRPSPRAGLHRARQGTTDITANATDGK